MPTVLIVRHALSVWNAEGRWQGQADPPLAPEGEAQARAASARVGPVDLVITSDLERARRTGQLVAPGVALEIEPGLREFDVGDWSGHTRAEIERLWPGELAEFDAGRLDAPPGSEGRRHFDERVAAAAGRVARKAVGRTLVVTHGGVVRALARHQNRRDGRFSHLCGFDAEVKGTGLLLLHPLDLLTDDEREPETGAPVAL
ncbi:MAG TPA: histidine phosphatase family protein [Acidimicrobiales bacterium]|jgi:probable phosphoglycerate mutase|nr:histidine phosphatase family protein [Acidimicrobiales bacterium]